MFAQNIEGGTIDVRTVDGRGMITQQPLRLTVIILLTIIPLADFIPLLIVLLVDILPVLKARGSPVCLH
ncbi:MAG: hypothetical protein EA366_13270 [Spirulina sp. DLM2.Bin59]|nr:MAG: hypothetical protein EA366_13270 [Spirulina sp. DLM2.Bin59]